MRYIQKNLNAYRDEIKGIAILGVVFYHARLGLSGFAYDVQKICYGGVDVFFFLSGFGLYHSLAKDEDMGRYLARRARRLLPAYLPFCAAWLCVMLPLYGMGPVQGLRTAAGNLFMIGFFADTPAMINWYVSAMAVSLLVAPVLYGCVMHAKNPLKRAGLLAGAAFIMGLCFAGTEQYMAISRLPVFIFGMAAALPTARQKGGTERGIALALMTGALFGLAVLIICFARYPDALAAYGMYWHPFALIAPAVCAGFGWLFQKAHKARRLFAPFRLMGRASFEIFLFNAWAEVLGKKFGLADGPFSWFIWSLCSIFAGIAYHLVVAACMKRVGKAQKKCI